MFIFKMRCLFHDINRLYFCCLSFSHILSFFISKFIFCHSNKHFHVCFIVVFGMTSNVKQVQIQKQQIVTSYYLKITYFLLEKMAF